MFLWPLRAHPNANFQGRLPSPILAKGKNRLSRKPRVTIFIFGATGKEKWRPVFAGRL
jgi:hypothetical protein